LYSREKFVEDRALYPIDEKKKKKQAKQRYDGVCSVSIDVNSRPDRFAMQTQIKESVQL
jgi:hypothetical protein